MTTFQADQIRRFLETVDKYLRAPVRLVIIGGGAALLGHGAKSPTRDIDTFQGNPLLLKEAVARAQAEIGFTVPIGSAAVADLPIHYEDRQQRPLPHLRRLEVLVPDRYDLVLSKLVRASQADLVVCREIHDHKPLEFDVLLRRYLNEMNHAIGRQADRDQNLVAAVEFIWNEPTADRAQKMIEQHRSKVAREPPPSPTKTPRRGRR